jgi:hypothetical protein
MASLRGLSLSGLSIATTACGLMGQTLLFRYFDADAELDLYFYSLAIPNFLAGQISLILGYCLVPFLTQYVPDLAQADFRRRFMLLLAGSCAAMAVPGIAVSLLVAQGAHGASAALSGSSLVWLVTLSWTSVVVANLNAAQTAFLNARLSFILPGLFPLITQLTMVLGLLLFSDLGIVMPLIGLNVGALVAFALGSLSLMRPRDGCITPDQSAGSVSCDASVWAFLRRVSLLPIVLCIFSAHFFVDALMSTVLAPGELSSLALAHRVNIGAVGIVVAAFAGPMTVELSRLVNQFYLRQYELVVYLRRLCFYGAAVGAVMFVNASALTTLLTGGATPRVQSSIADLLRILAIAGLPMLLGQFLLRALLAMHMHRRAAIAAGIWWAFYVLGAWCSAHLYGSTGLAVTYLLSWTALTAWSLFALDQPLRLGDIAVIVAAVAITAASALTGQVLASQIAFPSWLSQLAPLCVSTIAASVSAFLIDRVARKPKDAKENA